MSQQELLDEVDEKGRPTGRTETRQHAHDTGMLHRVSHVWIYSTTGKVLVQRRSQGVSERPGYLDVSIAGHILAGQEPLDCAVSELRQELGLTVEPGQLEFTGIVVERRDTPHMKKPHNLVTNIYLLEANESIATTFVDGEVDEVVWVSLAELERLMAGNVIDDKIVPRSAKYTKHVVDQIKGRVTNG